MFCLESVRKSYLLFHSEENYRAKALLHLQHEIDQGSMEILGPIRVLSVLRVYLQRRAGYIYEHEMKRSALSSEYSFSLP